MQSVKVAKIIFDNSRNDRQPANSKQHRKVYRLTQGAVKYNLLTLKASVGVAGAGWQHGAALHACFRPCFPG